MNDVDALVRCLIGVGREEDFAKAAGVAGIAKWIGKKLTHSTVRVGGKEVIKKKLLGGTKKVMMGGKKVQKFSPLRTGIAGLIGYEAIQAGRGASVQQAGYRPSARTYNPGARFA